MLVLVRGLLRQEARLLLLRRLVVPRLRRRQWQQERHQHPPLSQLQLLLHNPANPRTYSK